MKTSAETSWARFLSRYGMLGVLAGLCVFFSVVTIQDQPASGVSGARRLAREIVAQSPSGARILVVARDTAEEGEFARELSGRLQRAGFVVVGTVLGQPPEARAALQRLADDDHAIQIIAASEAPANWTVLREAGTQFSSLREVQLRYPRSHRGSNFLKTENLLNISNQIAVIAIVAVGATFVIITGGIDLSVGSLIALSAVVGTLLIRDVAGGEQATAMGMVLCGAAAVGVCALMGGVAGACVNFLRVPPFIVTLAMMLVASGLAFIVSRGLSIYQVPDSFVWLGRGNTLGLPNAVLLMALLYAAAHLMMKHTVLGRYLYAVGGNLEAARLSGVPVPRVIAFAYLASGALAGVGGMVMASQLKSGSPTYGQVYELYVIAAVVVGGTSLKGGEGGVLGTLIGAFIIAVIQNGMNLTGVESYTQKVVLGLVILGAVVLDNLKQRGWQWLRQRRAAAESNEHVPAVPATPDPQRTIS
ncbi:MAG TPA: ABC transporter permease [Verrucomicrobiota bacterium]|nr:ABC transporter permease [Verrucomicrobiota bacterium]